MIPHVKYLPADERRAVTVEAVVEPAAEQNPTDIATATIANICDAPRVFAIYRRGIGDSL